MLMNIAVIDAENVRVKHVTTYESRHEKNYLCHMRTTKAQISLHIRAVSSTPWLFTAWIV